MQEAQVCSLGQEDPLEKGMASYSSVLAWKIPWTEEPGGLQSRGSQRVGHDRAQSQANWIVQFQLGTYEERNDKKNPQTAKKFQMVFRNLLFSVVPPTDIMTSDTVIK